MSRALAPAILALTLLAAGCSSATQEASLAITNVTVIDGTDAPPLEGATILIQGNRITGILPSPVSLASGARVIDGTGKYAIPGLWEGHMHVSLLEGPDILPLFTAYGVTGVRDMGSPDYIFDLKNDVAAGRIVGPRIVTAGLAFVNYETPRGHPEPWARGVTSAEDAPAEVERLVGRADFVKIQDSFMEPEIWMAIAHEARINDLPLSGHIPFGLTLEQAIENGLTSIEHSLGLAPAFTSREAELRASVMAAKDGGDPWSALFAADAAAVAEIDHERLEAMAALMVANGVVIDANLKDLESMSYAASGRWHQDPRLELMDPAIGAAWIGAADSGFFNEANTANLRTTFEAIPALIARLQDLGVTIVAGTDAGAMFDFPGSDLHNELGLLVAGGLTPLEAIQSATISMTRYLGMADSLGTLKVGMLADLVLLDENPLADIANTSQLFAVVQNGVLFNRDALSAMMDRRVSSTN